MSVRVWFDFPLDGDRESVERSVEQVPRVGELVGILELAIDTFRLERVMEVRHYLPGDDRDEIRVLVGD